MRDGKNEAEGVGKLRLQFRFPGTGASTVTAAGIAKDEKLAGAWIAPDAFLAPPMGNGVNGKGWCVMRDTDGDRAAIGQQIVDAIRDGDAGGVGAEIMIVDQDGCQIPSCARIVETSDQFALLGVDADNGMALASKSVAKITDVEELIVAIGARTGG